MGDIFIEIKRKIMKIVNVTEYYKSKFIEQYGDTYDYSKMIAIRSNIKTIVICKSHGEFLVTPNNHLNKKSGCPSCKNIDKNFIKTCSIIHKNYYDYSLVEYKSNRIKVKIICPNHGIFEQLPMNHKLGSCCPKCSIKNRKSNLDDLIQIGKEIHSNKYDYRYLKEDYIRSDKKVRIVCPDHGIFLQDPSSHFKRKHGCKLCKKISTGESIIKEFLNEKKVDFLMQKTFDDCVNLSKLSFDFYVPSLNLCIEFNGRQHYLPISVFGGQDQFIKQIKNDRIKNEYCVKNNINLLTIRYNDDIINKLSKYLQSTKDIHDNR